MEAGVSTILRASTCVPKRLQLFPPLLCCVAIIPTSCSASVLTGMAMQCILCGSVALGGAGVVLGDAAGAGSALGEMRGMVALAVHEWDMAVMCGACQVGCGVVQCAAAPPAVSAVAGAPPGS